MYILRLVISKVTSLARRTARPSVLAATLVVAATGTASAYAGTWFTSSVSEETQPASCADDTVMNALWCYGSYCDNIQGRCRNTSQELERHYWTPYLSEEEGYNRCNPGYFVTEIDCQGSYCDNKSLQCTRLAGATHSACHWEGPFSEEGTNNRTCGDKLMAGLYCSGSYCDNVWLYCCNP